MRTRTRGGLARLLLRRAALRYAEHGWDVLPGAFLSGDRFSCGPGCQTVACHPAWMDWREIISHDQRLVGTWWTALPYSVLLATGRAFDVLEISAFLGASTAMGPPTPATGAHAPTASLRATGGPDPHGERPPSRPDRRNAIGTAPVRARGPVARGASGRWFLFVRTGAALRPELAGRTDVVLHGAGSWIPAPPTRAPEGRVRWVVSPAEVDWRLPDAEPVQQRILDALPVMWQNAIPAPMRAA
jgi:Bifunctional DNA primase/polymerase, N-terminal